MNHPSPVKASPLLGQDGSGGLRSGQDESSGLSKLIMSPLAELGSERCTRIYSWKIDLCTFAALIPTLNVARMFLFSSRTLSHFLQVQNFKLLAVPEEAKLDCQKNCFDS